MRYSWDNPSSLIREVEIRTRDTHCEGIIYAPASADPEKLRPFAEALRADGLVVIPDVVNDRFALRIEKLESADQLLASLVRHQAVDGAPRLEATEADASKRGFVDKLRQNTVKSAGYAYVLGDALMILAGLVRMKGLEGKARQGGISELATGTLWFAPNVALAAFGKKNPDVQMGVLMRKVQEHLEKEGVEIPEEDKLTLEHLSRKDGALARIVEFFYDHPTEINNSIEAAGGVLMIKGGYEQKLGLPEKSQPNPFKMAAGVFVGSGMGASVVMKEKDKKAEEKDKADESGAISRWFSKPLRVAGTGALINNILNIIGSTVWEGPKVKKFLNEEYQPEKDRLSGILNATDGADWQNKAKAAKNLEALETQKIVAGNYGTAAKLNLGTAAAFMLANGMYAMGSKDTGTDIKALGGLDQVYAITAHVIAAQPTQHQPELINRMAGFLASLPDIKEPSEQVATTLSERVKGLSRSPWTQRVQPPASAEIHASL